MPSDPVTPLALSIVIPAYNEARRIGASIGRIRSWLDDRRLPAEIIVVSDGSTDATVAVVLAAAAGDPRVRVIDLGRNQGKGAAVRAGVLAAAGDHVLFTDADLSTPITEADRLLAALQAGAAVAIGSRAHPDSRVEVHQPWWRERMGKIFNWFVRRLAMPDLRDTQCGFKCFPRAVARELFGLQRVDRFGFDVEILWLARKRGLRIAEVPVLWVDDANSRVHPVRDSTRMLLDLLRIRLLDRRGAYDQPGEGRG